MIIFQQAPCRVCLERRKDDDAEPFSQPGDSGSLIVAANPVSGSNDREALALLFAGGRTTEGTDITIASPIEFVVREVGYTL